jgi:hypothetical protein
MFPQPLRLYTAASCAASAASFFLICSSNLFFSAFFNLIMVTSSRLGVFGLNENFGVPKGVAPAPVPRIDPNDALKDFAAGVAGAEGVAEGLAVEVDAPLPLVTDDKSSSLFAHAISSSAG